MKKKSILNPHNLSKKEILARREQARQRPVTLKLKADVAKAVEAQLAANRQSILDKAAANAAFEAKSERRKQLLESASKHRASVMADWGKRKIEDDFSPSELGIDSGTAKPLDLIRRR